MSSPVVAPLPGLIRIRVTGEDRLRFVHNFCTNDINGLAPGRWCEAFFVNMKARVLAHGWVLAADNRLEIWMLPGDEAALMAHLDRYIIMDDVELESLTEQTRAVAVIAPADAESVADGSWSQQDVSGLCRLNTTWHEQALSLYVGPADCADLPQPEDESSAAVTELERLRIQERFPLVGRDLTDAHLAPEAGRNRTAISYTKGCYLGQEPIARLDAMGQVNRILAAVQATDSCDESDAAIDFPSWDDTVSPAVGLGIVKADSLAGSTVTVRSPQGQTYSATVTQPRSLTGD